MGELELPNRVIMAPLTRLRGTPDHVPTEVMVEYYRQRAGAGLIVSEGIPVSPQGVGYAQVPGLWSDGQMARWQPVTQAVHHAGGRIFAQIWHVQLPYPGLAVSRRQGTSTALGQAKTYVPVRLLLHGDHTTPSLTVRTTTASLLYPTHPWPTNATDGF